MDEDGWRRLMALSALHFDHLGEGDRRGVPLSAVLEDTGGLFCLTGGPDGPLDRLAVAGQEVAARALVDELGEAFPDSLGVEIQRHGLDSERRAETVTRALAVERGLPLVATHEPYFPVADDHEAHEVLLCIRDGKLLSDDGRRRVTGRHYFTGQDEMARLFADLPEALANTVAVARRCIFRPRPRLPRVLRFSGRGADGEEGEALLRRMANEGLGARLAAAGGDALPRADYERRLAHELDVIARESFVGYFLIVADMVGWAREQGIPVGPGRGSGAGSLTAWALGVTDVDPLRFGLLFERFLNPARVSMPDFDIDFCQERRDEVFEYLVGRYGADRVAHITAFGSLQARAVMRDTGRVLGMSYGHTDRLCKMAPYPADPLNPPPLADVIAAEPKLRAERDRDPVVARMMAISARLEGLYRHTTTHAAGVVISTPEPVGAFVPTARDAGSGALMSQYSMKWVEEAGLVKFDLLGLKTLTVLQRARDMLARRGVTPRLDDIPDTDGPDADRPNADRAVFAMLARGDSVGVFQLEGEGVRNTLRQMQPDRFEDLVALVALYRPGPMDNIARYIACKHGREQPRYLHPSLEKILKGTFGVAIYQEQVMETAREIAGYDLAEADILRRAMGKKIQSEMAAQRTRFIGGAVERGVEPAVADRLFEEVRQFAGYGFNRSHAVCYALLAWRTAWMKTHYPREFLAAAMTCDIDNVDRIALFQREARRLGVEVAAVDINRSEGVFVVEGEAIVHGLASVRNVGQGAAAAIVAERREGGKFADVFDFVRRMGSGRVNRRTIEALARAGAFDTIHANRRQLVEGADVLARYGASAEREKNSRQGNLFGGEGGATVLAAPALGDVAPWSREECLAAELEAAGLHLSGDPLDAWEDAMRASGIGSWSDVRARGAMRGEVAAVVQSVRVRTSRKSDLRYAHVGLSDRDGGFEAVVFSRVLERSEAILKLGGVVAVELEADDGGRDAGANMRLQVLGVRPLEKAVRGRRRAVSVRSAPGPGPSAPEPAPAPGPPAPAPEPEPPEPFLSSGLSSAGGGAGVLEVALAREGVDVGAVCACLDAPLGLGIGAAGARRVVVVAQVVAGDGLAEVELALPEPVAVTAGLLARLRAIPGVRVVRR